MISAATAANTLYTVAGKGKIAGNGENFPGWLGGGNGDPVAGVCANVRQGVNDVILNSNDIK